MFKSGSSGGRALNMNMPESMETPLCDPTSERAIDSVLRERAREGGESEQRQYTTVEKKMIGQFLEKYDESIDELIGYYGGGDKFIETTLSCPSVTDPNDRKKISHQEKDPASKMARFSEAYRRSLILLANSSDTQILGENMTLFMASKYDRYKNGTDVVGTVSVEKLEDGSSEEVSIGINNTREPYKKNAENSTRIKYAPKATLAERKSAGSLDTAISAEITLSATEEARVIMLGIEIMDGNAEELKDSSVFKDIQKVLKAEIGGNISESISRHEAVLDDDGVGDTVKAQSRAYIENLKKIKSTI